MTGHICKHGIWFRIKGYGLVFRRFDVRLLKPDEIYKYRNG